MYIPLLDFKQTVSKRSEEYKCGLGEANCLCRLKIYKVNHGGYLFSFNNKCILWVEGVQKCEKTLDV